MSKQITKNDSRITDLQREMKEYNRRNNGRIDRRQKTIDYGLLWYSMWCLETDL